MSVCEYWHIAHSQIENAWLVFSAANMVTFRFAIISRIIQAVKYWKLLQKLAN